MKCGKCGFEFDDSYDFCPKCGEPMNHASHDDKTDINSGMHWDDSNEPSESEVNNYSSTATPIQNKKKFFAIGAALLILIIVIAISGNSKTKEVKTKSYSNSEAYESDASSNDNYYDSETEMDAIQGSWDLLGVTNDGESVYVGDTPYSGSLDIYDNTWTMTIYTTDTTTYSGRLEYDYTNSGYYVYKLHADTGTGTVSMGYSLDKKFIIVSTQSYLDPDNNYFFSK